MLDGLRILLRATNWVGDVVISLPALRALRAHHRGDRIAVRLRTERERIFSAPCRFTRCPLDHACMTGLAVGSVLRSTLYATHVE